MQKSISDGRSVENISDKRLRNEVQPAQTNGVERVKRFVNVHLHCALSATWKHKQNFDVAPWKNFCGRPRIRRRYVQVWIIARRWKQGAVGWFLESIQKT